MVEATWYLLKDGRSVAEGLKLEALDESIAPLGCELAEQGHRDEHLLLNGALTTLHDFRERSQ